MEMIVTENVKLSLVHENGETTWTFPNHQCFSIRGKTLMIDGEEADYWAWTAMYDLWRNEAAVMDFIRPEWIKTIPTDIKKRVSVRPHHIYRYEAGMSRWILIEDHVPFEEAQKRIEANLYQIKPCTDDCCWKWGRFDVTGSPLTMEELVLSMKEQGVEIDHFHCISGDWVNKEINPYNYPIHIHVDDFEKENKKNVRDIKLNTFLSVVADEWH